MKPWLGTSEFLTDGAEQALMEQRGREILAQQARRSGRKAAIAKAKTTPDERATLPTRRNAA